MSGEAEEIEKARQELAEDLLYAFMTSVYVCEVCWKKWRPADHYPGATVKTTFQVPKCCDKQLTIVIGEEAELN